MTDVEQFIARALAYCAKAQVSPSTVSRKLLGNGKRLSELKAGQGSLRVDTFQRAKERLDQLERAA
jgi:hypothetical protein